MWKHHLSSKQSMMPTRVKAEHYDAEVMIASSGHYLIDSSQENQQEYKNSNWLLCLNSNPFLC